MARRREQQFDEGDKVRRWKSHLDNPQKALKQVGILLVSEIQGHFATESFGKEKWLPRGKVNTMGILADFAEGLEEPKARRFDRRPVLQDTGRLASSITYRLRGSKTVEVGTNVDYAAVHQYGRESKSPKITKAIQAALWSWLAGQDRKLKKKLGWLLNRKLRGKSITTKVPRRRFIGLTPEAKKGIEKTLKIHIWEVKR